MNASTILILNFAVTKDQNSKLTCLSCLLTNSVDQNSTCVLFMLTQTHYEASLKQLI